MKLNVNCKLSNVMSIKLPIRKAINLTIRIHNFITHAYSVRAKILHLETMSLRNEENDLRSNIIHVPS